MRRLGLLAALSLSSFVLASCGSDRGPVSAHVTWQVRCPSGFMGCASGGPVRDVNNVNGEGGHNISCAVTGSANLKILRFHVYKGAEYGIDVSNAAFDPTTGTLSGAGCSMTVLEGNEYQGTCGANPPTAAQPCRITNVAITDTMAGPEVSGSILCRNIAADVDPTMYQRDVTADTDADTPFDFRLDNCDGT